MISVDGGSTARYVYNTSGQRTESVTPSNTVDFIFDPAGRVITEAISGNWERSELYAGGLHVASYANSTTYFDHSDWLGTVRALNTVSGTNYQNCSSLAFGDAQSCTGSPWYALQFTGDEHDNESNLEHTWFWQYSSTQGRWTVPDPSGMAAVNPADPQTWNRYAYVGNRPLNTVDPNGLDGDCSINPDDPSCDWCAWDPFFCIDPCGTDPFFCAPSGGGGGGGGGGGAPAAPITPDQLPRTGGRYGSVNNETLGLPPGIKLHIGSLGDLFGLNPNGPCDFGVCRTIGSNLLESGIGPSALILDSYLLSPWLSLACFGGNLQACLNECNSGYWSCQLKEGFTGWLCLGFGPGSGPHGGQTCGSFGSDVCLHNRDWCQQGCQASCVGPYPPTITPPPVGPPHPN